MKRNCTIRLWLALLLFPLLLPAQERDLQRLDPRIDSLMSLVQTAFDQKDPETVIRLITNTEEQVRNEFGEQSYEYAEVVFQHGRALRFQDKNPEAEEKYRQSLDIYRNTIGEQHPAVAKNLFNLAALQLVTGRMEESEANMIHSMEIRKTVFGPDHISLVDNLNWLTDLYFRKGQYERALTYTDTALQILTPQVPESDPEFTKSLYWNALLLTTVGQYEKSEEAYLRLLDIRIRSLGKDHPETAAVRNNLGLLYWRIGRFAEAEEQWLETIRIREESLGNNHSLTIRSIGNMGIFYFDTGNMEKAEVFFKRSLQGLAETTGKDSPDYARALNNLSSLYHENGDLVKAEPLVKEGLEILERKFGREHPDFAISLYNYASLQNQLGHLDIAKTALKETEAIRRKTLGNHHYDLGLTLMSLARLERSQGQLDKAQTYILEAESIFAESVGEKHPDHISALVEHALLEEMAGHTEVAVGIYVDIARLDQDAIQQALYYLSDVEILKYLYRFRLHQDRMMSFAMQSGSPVMAELAYDQTLFLKGFLLYARQKMVRTAMTDPVGKELYTKLKEDYGQLAQEMAKPRSERDSLLLVSLTEKTNQLEKDLARAVGKVGMELTPVRWKDVQSQLKSGELAVEIVTYSPFPGAPADSAVYAALLLKPGTEKPQMIRLFKEGQLNSLLSVKTDRRSDYVNDLYAYAERGLTTSEEEQSSLMELIWTPLSEHIENAKTLYVASGGVLHRINLAAIPTSEEKVLADDFKMVNLGSTRHLVISEEGDNVPPGEAMIFGGIRFDPDSLASIQATSNPTSRGEGNFSGIPDSSRGGTWSYLTWTVKEAKTIAEILEDHDIKTRNFADERATEEAFKDLGKGVHGNRILHLATHGFFFPDPATMQKDNPEQVAFQASDDPMIRSGLVLANGNYAWQHGQPMAPGMEDGILTAFEISQMNLSNTELVVLSACETGLGDIQGNEGVYGLQRAFKIAGAKYLIMSLWQVPDRETMQFMTTFYQNWLPTDAKAMAGKEEHMSIPEAFRKTQLEMRDRFFNPYSWAGFVLVE